MLAYRLVRLKNVLMGMYFYQLCKRKPERARELILKGVRFLLGVSNAPTYPIVAGTFANWFPVGRWAFPNAVSSSGLALGQAAIGPLVTVLIVHFGWRLLLSRQDWVTRCVVARDQSEAVDLIMHHSELCPRLHREPLHEPRSRFVPGRRRE